MTQGKGNWQAYFEKWHITLIALQKSFPLAYLVSVDPRYVHLYEDNLNMDISNIYDESILDKNDNLFILRDFFRYVETFEDKLSDASLGCIKVRYFNKWKYKLLTEDYTISIDIDDSKFEDIESYINEERFFD